MRHLLVGSIGVIFIKVFFPFFAYPQVGGGIVDKCTKQPVPYANIYVLGKKTGTTANELGYFSIGNSEENDTLVVSAIGYETSKVRLLGVDNMIYLNAIEYHIKEVEVRPKKGSKTITMNSLKGRKTNNTLLSNAFPWIVARYFQKRPDYNHYHFVKSAGVIVRNRAWSAKFKLRLLEVGEDGKPAADLIENGVLVKVRRGKRIVKVDLEEYGVVFPDNGIFVAIETLMIDDNRNNFTYTEPGRRKKIVRSYFEPNFGIFYDDSCNTHMFFSDGWVEQNSKIFDLAVELVLTD